MNGVDPDLVAKLVYGAENQAIAKVLSILFIVESFTLVLVCLIVVGLLIVNKKIRELNRRLRRDLETAVRIKDEAVQEATRLSKIRRKTESALVEEKHLHELTRSTLEHVVNAMPK